MLQEIATMCNTKQPMKTILTLLLAAMSTGALAEWVAIGNTDDSTAYADAATIRRSGSTAKMWNLSDYKTAQKLGPGKSYMSAKLQLEYDCREERARNLFLSYHSGNMGDGTLIDVVIETSRWLPLPPGSEGEALWKIACGKQ